VYRERKTFAYALEQRLHRAHHSSIRSSLSKVRKLLRRFAKNDLVAIDEPTRMALSSRFDELINTDFVNFRLGYYPRSLLFQMPWVVGPRVFSRFVKEVLNQRKKAAKRKTSEFDSCYNLENYPEYYRHNFHWQTNGYLSDSSAELYALSVEFLFMGLANVMRRQLIPDIVRHARRTERENLRVLDVACGTGELLDQIQTTLPKAQLYGVDLSPAYLKCARNRFESLGIASLAVANAEALPYPDQYFDVVTNVYLLHELPADARRKALGEMLRVLKPGGTLLVQDSLQHGDAPDLNTLLNRYGEEANEPYFDCYLADDVAQELRRQGASIHRTFDCFVAKTVVAQKPIV